MAKRHKPITPAVEFWRAEYEASCTDLLDCPDNMRPAHVKAKRDAWREWQGALSQRTTEAEPDESTLEGQLAIAHRMRRAAEAAGSWVAARDLLRSATEISQAIRARDEAEAERRMEHLDEQQLVDSIIEIIDVLPELLQRRLRDALRRVA